MSCPRLLIDPRGSEGPEGSIRDECSETVYDYSTPVDNVLVDWCGNAALPEVKLRFRVQCESNTSKFRNASA